MMNITSLFAWCCAKKNFSCGDVMSRSCTLAFLATLKLVFFGWYVRCRDATSSRHVLFSYFVHSMFRRRNGLWPISNNPCESQTKLWHLLKSTMMYNQQILSKGDYAIMDGLGKSYFTKIGQSVQRYWTVVIRRAWVPSIEHCVHSRNDL